MKVSFITPFDAKDVNKWSGIPCYIVKHLSPLCEDFEYVGPLKKKSSLKQKLRRIWHKKILKKRYLKRREPEVTASYARQSEELLKGSDADAVLTPWTLAVSDLQTDKPIVLWSDACFGSLVDFYAQFTNLCDRSLKDGHALEQKALDRCKYVVYSSQWAADGAIEHYNLPHEKVKVIPFGANIECDRTESDIEAIISNKQNEVCKLLFLGKDWKRKGGEIALNVVKQLNERGTKTELTVVGCTPEFEDGIPEYVNIIGFLNKATDAGCNKLNQLLEESHFMILPTYAEAYGIVFCEASSYGLPSIALDRGGVPVTDQVNGLLFDVDAPIDEYCEKIETLMNDGEAYAALARSSFKEYSENLNWNVASQRMLDLLETIK